MTTGKTQITRHTAGKVIEVVRTFNAAPERIWKAWTDPAILDTWWAPGPWKAETKKMDFTPGGMWLYCMVGPQAERHWCRVDILTVEPIKYFTSVASFCDEDGNITQAAPPMQWYVVFAPSGSGTKVTVEISFSTEDEMNQIIAMGFEQGFTMGLDNLESLLAKQ